MEQILRDIITGIITYGVIGWIGFRQVRRFKRPVNVLAWVLLVIGAVVLGYVFPSAAFLSVFGFTVYVSWTLHAFVLGLLAGLVVREIRQNRQIAQKSVAT